MAIALVAGLAVAGCSSGETVQAPPPPADVVVHEHQPGQPFDRRLLGTNLPAWVGPAQLADPGFVAATKASGATVIRMPGGSWSDGYDWLACENHTAECIGRGAARPQDYAGFLAATGANGMWTVNVNDTAQSAAALVAYFNGAVDDTRPIGTDRHGVDWQTVGTWAQLRAVHGHREPVGVQLWEVGNEVFGAKSSAEGACASFGWEDAWTCDGQLYVEGDADHDGFLAIRAAMRAVDPSIAVGAVGSQDQTSWSRWGEKVLGGTAGQLDFYVLHQYGFGKSPSTGSALASPTAAWSKDMPATDVPIAVTEYNLVSSIDADDDASMTKAVNALYIAESIGEMAAHGVSLANQWNLINGAASNGADYGMLDAASRAAPQYAALALWSRFGTTMVPVDVGQAPRLAAYASTEDTSTIVLLVNGAASTRLVRLSSDAFPAGVPAHVTIGSMAATSADATEMVPNTAALTGWAPYPAPAQAGAANVPPPPVDVGVATAPDRGGAAGLLDHRRRAHPALTQRLVPSPTMPQRPRVAFAIEQTLGHLTHSDNLRRLLADSPTIELVAVPIPGDAFGAARPRCRCCRTGRSASAARPAS